jgi:hypothetical protein
VKELIFSGAKREIRNDDNETALDLVLGFQHLL